MYRTKTETKLVWWPTPQDYNEAVQVPKLSLQDPELRDGLPYTNALDLPRSITGSFASVYRMHCKHKDFALRLFLSNIHDQQERYALISDFVQHDDLPYTVTFDFLKQGIKIHGDWLPALKMDWLEGEQLDDYIVQHLGDPVRLGVLLEKFVRMMQDLQRAGIAHGDLQHGNILVCQDELRLVDYDGMFVPSMEGYSAGELGHRNYQHPARAAHHFGPYLDNFSAWIIYASVRALQIDSRLMHQLGGGDDCLLFRQSDFLDPIHSPAFAAMERHPDVRLNELSKFIRAQLKADLPHIPFLGATVPAAAHHELHPIAETAPVIKNGARIVRGNLPDWLQNDNAEVLAKSDASAEKIKTTTKRSGQGLPPVSPLYAPGPKKAVPQSWTVPTKPAQQAAWLKPGVAASMTNTSTSTSNNFTSPPPLSGTHNKLTNLTNTINSAAQRKQHQLQSAKHLQSPQAQVGQALANQSSQRLSLVGQPVTRHTTPLSAPLPPELSHANVPRKVQWNGNCGRISPRDIFVIMLVNPLMWLMVNFGSNALGIDAQLASHAVTVPAVVTNVDTNLSSKNYRVVDYKYTFNGNVYHQSEERSIGAPEYTKGSTYPIAVLPSNPTIREPLSASPGKKLSVDNLLFALMALVNLIILIALLSPALWQRNLAKNGQAFRAKVDSTRVLGEKLCVADLSWLMNGSTVRRTIQISKDEYFALCAGDTEIILCDKNANNVVLYRFCRYNAVPPRAPAITVINP
ncbi:MAG: hypothetical protein U0103_10540 [Candidatus Obscuribacterales bacterium]